jgi:hypothetical protein
MGVFELNVFAHPQFAELHLLVSIEHLGIAKMTRLIARLP